ncbi:ArsR/SmtB family transcription factor [Erythrobacter sp. EC-HK427]|uniref:ArsR/SmtB family transcription factor n=1 Tax=Erythrobacter sp. EC-HK427 TaxID=2038396 RepID=UPI0012533CB1|nr:metalloregulator ArsR/SmtB family transcription factor [Erythrobacter sp. EC-HK427]VVS99019.1 Transcriptional regulator [Erythrobacter sp. EC-HK427]
MSDDVIEELKALAHPLRLRILEVLRDGERNVGEIEEAAQITQPALSQQLGVLRKAGLVDTRKQAKLVYYRLEEAPIAALAKRFESLLGPGRQPDAAVRTPSPGAANFARLT